MHEPFNVLQHHDRIVHHNADGQHHTKQCEGVDAVAQQMQARQGPNQRHRYGQHRDDGGAPTLQEKVDHQKHQHHCFAQRFEHLLNRLRHERCGVIRRGISQAFRELGFELLQGFFNRCARVQCVGTGLQKHPYRHRRMTIDAAIKVVVFAAQFNPRHVFQAGQCAVGTALDHDVGKLFRLQQSAFGGHRQG